MSDENSGVSQPDQTNADNPSDTGVPSVDSQGTDKEIKPGTVEEQASRSDSDKNPANHTVPYGADAKQTQARQPELTAREYAERQVLDNHGEPFRQNPQFDAVVKDTMKQIDANREATKNM